MLDNNYLNLYQTDFYEMKKYFLGNNVNKSEVVEFENMFSLVNVLYVESKKCIDFIENEVKIVNDSKIIYAILECDQSIFEMLKEVYEIDRVTYIGKNMTYLQVAVMVCSEHLKKINNVLHK